LENPKDQKPISIKALDVPPRVKQSTYPEPFRSRMNNRIKAQLGEFFGIKNFGINLTRIHPGGESALLHKHTKQDEFIYILEGEATLVTENGEYLLTSGMCAGFPANGSAHQLVNRSKSEVLYLEVGDRTPNDEATYPRDDLKASMNTDGSWKFTHKDGTPYVV
jgi:uncharacterized cupin superfamily protein